MRWLSDGCINFAATQMFILHSYSTIWHDPVACVHSSVGMECIFMYTHVCTLRFAGTTTKVQHMYWSYFHVSAVLISHVEFTVRMYSAQCARTEMSPWNVLSVTGLSFQCGIYWFVFYEYLLCASCQCCWLYNLSEAWCKWPYWVALEWRMFWGMYIHVYITSQILCYAPINVWYV